MCAILGLFINDVREKDLGLIRKLFNESQIRGKHATGYSYFDKKIVTQKEPIPGSEFIEKYNPEIFLGKNLTMIAHFRYSTSDLEYNQPISDSRISIVHNGVITQEPFDKWEGDFQTKNDSEFVYKSHRNASHPLKDYPDASMAVCGLSQDKLFFYRNGKRPLHYSTSYGNLIISSTRDIIERSISDAKIQECIPGVEYSIEGAMHSFKRKSIRKDIKDLQYGIC
jgi:glutamine phosphoribosylpyrophosphate amidotransferase